MKRLRTENINTPENSDKSFIDVMKRDKGFDYGAWDVWESMLRYYDGGKLLDIGCRNSPLAYEMHKKFPNADITILDFSPVTVRYFKENCPYVNAVLSDCRKTPFKDNAFDYISAGQIIEHLEKPEELIKEAIRILKPNGYLVLSTPFEEKENEMRGGGTHLWSYTIKDIEGLLKSYGETEVEKFTRKNTYEYIIGFIKKVVGSDNPLKHFELT